MALKLNIHFTPSNGWFDQFRKCAGPGNRTSGESKRVPEERVGAWKMGVQPTLLSEYHKKDIFNADESVHCCAYMYKYAHIYKDGISDTWRVREAKVLQASEASVMYIQI
jgi:hypothetical protein